MNSHLPNYLRANRKRLALSQDEVAYLLGVGNGAKVCRHERFVRVPELETLLVYEAIFQRPLRELFAGTFEQVRDDVAARAKALISRTVTATPTKRNARKCEALTHIANPTLKLP